MQLQQLRYFTAVAETLHFTRAAERVHVSQPSLSQQIRALEQELGADLFRRARGNIALTDAGQALLPLARRILADTVDVLERSGLEPSTICTPASRSSSRSPARTTSYGNWRAARSTWRSWCCRCRPRRPRSARSSWCGRTWS
jgi:DNA-binding transcriptional LysR family regulator